ncbi:MAG: hypothetical protein R2838_09310 [Caldilineaceae bacterium]
MRRSLLGPVLQEILAVCDKYDVRTANFFHAATATCIRSSSATRATPNSWSGCTRRARRSSRSAWTTTAASPASTAWA